MVNNRTKWGWVYRGSAALQHPSIMQGRDLFAWEEARCWEVATFFPANYKGEVTVTWVGSFRFVSKNTSEELCWENGGNCHSDIERDLHSDAASRVSLLGLWAPSLFLLSLVKNSQQSTPTSPPHISDTKNWQAVNGGIFKGRPGTAWLPQGSLSLRPSLRRDRNSVDVTQADWSSAPSLEWSVARRWQTSLELSVRPLWQGNAAGCPQGPISFGVPRKAHQTTR